MSRLFKRSYKLTLDTIEIEGTGDGNDLRVAFKILKTLKAAPNKAEIAIYNLNADHRQSLVKRFSTQLDKNKRKPVAVNLEAGYADDRGVIFSGDLRTLSVEKDGSDWVTKVQGSDGGHAYRTARVSRNFGPGTHVADVMKACADAMAIGVGNINEVIGTAKVIGLGLTYPEGTTIDGSAHDVFDRLAKACGFEWSIQNGSIQIKQQGQPLQRRAYKLSPSTGLIGSPTPEVDAEVLPGKSGTAQKKPAGLISLRSLLIHQLYPGVKVDVESADYNGGYQLTEVEFAGDTHGEDWFVNAKARPY